MKKIILMLLFLSIITPCLAKDIIKETNKQLYKITLGEDNDEVIIGDEKKIDTFKSKVTFTKWNKEESFSIVYDKAFSGIPVLKEGIYSIEGSKEKFYFKVNPDDDSELKFGLILKEKPLSNKFTYQLENWENFDFFYQYEDMTDWIKHPEILISETDDEARLFVDGEEYIVYKKYWKGYAVYHKTKCNHIEGKTDYKIGKIGNFLRPRFIDDNGKIEIADLNIENGIYTITISQEFLDKVKYPVLMNDQFGYTAAPTYSGTSINTATYVFGRSSMSQNGTVTSTKAYIMNESATDYTYSSGLYDDADGNYPSNRVINGTAVTVTTEDIWDWWEVNVADTLLSAGYYWFASSANNGNIKQKYDISGADMYNYASWFPNPYPDGDSSITRKYGHYAIYTVSGGGTIRNNTIGTGIGRGIGGGMR